jgi:hypothetical protein
MNILKALNILKTHKIYITFKFMMTCSFITLKRRGKLAFHSDKYSANPV